MAAPASGLRIALVDDHPLLLRGALDAITEHLPVADSVTCRQVDDVLATDGPWDIVILDLQLRDGSDPAGNVALLVERGWSTLLYTQETHTGTVARCFRAGASGIVGKGEELETLVDAVRIVTDGQPYLSGDWASALEADAHGIPSLSPRELEALRLYAAGLPMKSVARRMGISPETVKEYLMRVRRRYHEVGRPATTKTELYFRAVEDGFLAPPTDQLPRNGG